MSPRSCGRNIPSRLATPRRYLAKQMGHLYQNAEVPIGEGSDLRPQLAQPGRSWQVLAISGSW